MRILLKTAAILLILGVTFPANSMELLPPSEQGSSNPETTVKSPLLGADLFHYPSCDLLEHEIPNLAQYCDDDLYVIDIRYDRRIGNTISDFLNTSSSIHDEILESIPDDVDLSKVIGEIYTLSNCNPIIYRPLTKSIQIDGKLSCDKYRFGHISALTISNSYTSESLIATLKAFPFVQKYGLEVTRLNDNLIYVYSLKPVKSIIISSREYWEKVSMLVSLDKENITIVLEGKYAAGKNEPNEHEFKISNPHFHEDFKNLSLKIRNYLTR